MSKSKVEKENNNTRVRLLHRHRALDESVTNNKHRFARSLLNAEEQKSNLSGDDADIHTLCIDKTLEK